jgi:hypothetical protein
VPIGGFGWTPHSFKLQPEMSSITPTGTWKKPRMKVYDYNQVGDRFSISTQGGKFFFSSSSSHFTNYSILLTGMS